MKEHYVEIMGKSVKHGYWLLEHMPFDYPEDSSDCSSGYQDLVTIQNLYDEEYTNKIVQVGFSLHTKNPQKWIDFAKKNSAEIETHELLMA